MVIPAWFAGYIEHLGSAHDDAELELLKAAARERVAAGQGELDLGLKPSGQGSGPLPITSSRMGCLLEALTRAYDVLGLGAAALSWAGENKRGRSA